MSIATVEALEALDAKRSDLWHAWLFAEAEASVALATWNRAPHDDKARAYAAYVAALEREEQAGRVLARCAGAAP